MTHVGQTFGWLVVQVTVVAAVALALDVMLARRCAAAAAKALAGGLALVVLLTVVAFCPMPGWWAVPAKARVAERAIPGNDPGEPPTGGGNAGEPSGGLRFPDLSFFLHPRTATDSWATPGAVVVGVWSAGVVGCGGLLALGLVGVARLRRQSRLVRDEQLDREVSELAHQLGLRRGVEVRSADDEHLPATVGWLRPVILLPCDWRAWDAGDRRAVLAHELAHIRQGDFLSELVGSLSRALHFYHPLARRLLARLRLRQELAADALAASVAGGRDVYLRALARLALGNDRRPTDRPTGVLSARGGFLFRRIAMLRNKHEARPLSRLAQHGVLAGLVAVAALTSALRVPVDAAPPAAAQVEPFDLSYVCTDQTPNVRAVLGIRPNVLCAQPAVQKYVKALGPLVEATLTKEGMGLPDVKLADVEQVVMDLHFSTQGTGKPGSRSVSTGASGIMVRLTKEVDWEKVIRALTNDVTVKDEGGTKVYFVKSPMFGKVEVPFYAPDRRTLVMGSPKPVKGKPRTLAAGWKHVERATIAFALDNGDGHYTKAFATDAKDSPEGKAVLEQLKDVAGGIDLGDVAQGAVYFQAKDEAAGQKLHDALTVGFNRACREARDHRTTNSKADAVEQAWLKLVEDATLAGTLTRTGAEVKAASRVKVDLGTLFKLF